MARSNVMHDVAQLLGKYVITDILDEMITMASDESLDVMKKWFIKNFDIKRDIGDDIEEDAIKFMNQEIERIRIRLSKLERGIGLEEKYGDMQTTGRVPKEIEDAIHEWRPQLTEDDIRTIWKHAQCGQKFKDKSD